MSENVVLTCPKCDTRFTAPVAQFMPTGRQVRCSQCRHMWFHALSDAGGEAVAPRPAVRVAPTRPAMAGPTGALVTRTVQAASENGVPEKAVTEKLVPEKGMPEKPPYEAARSYADAPSDRPARKRGGWVGPILWLIALLLLLAILAYAFRSPLRAAVPQAAPMLDRYTEAVDRTAQGLVGRKAATPALELRNIHYDVNEEDGDREILVEADLFNTGSSDLPAPKVRVSVVDADRAPLHASIIGPEDMSETIPAGGSTRYFVRIPEPPADFEAVLVSVSGQE